MAQLQFFNPYADIRESENRLPHWQQRGAVYFVTFRLADAIPSHLLREWREERDIWLKLYPRPWTETIEREYHRQFSGRVEEWLDAGHGSCVLRQPDCAAIVESALAYFDGQRIIRISSVVMPNHVHVLFVQNPAFDLEKILPAWKSYPARKINSIAGEAGSLWQRDYFDRLVRDEQHFANCVRYIRRNPGKVMLKPGEYILYETETAKEIE